MAIFEIREFNQDAKIDEMFTDKKFPTFNNIQVVGIYLKCNYTYGKVFKYDDIEYIEYFINGTNIYTDIPEPLDEWVTDELIK